MTAQAAGAERVVRYSPRLVGFVGAVVLVVATPVLAVAPATAAPAVKGTTALARNSALPALLGPAQAPGKPKVVVLVRPSKAAVNATVAVSGRVLNVSKPSSYRVVLERKSGRNWARLASYKTNRQKQFSGRYRTPSRATTLTLRASLTRGGKRVASSKAWRVTVRSSLVAKQTASLVGPAATYVNKVITLSAKFTPALAGRRVVVQQRFGEEWVTVANASEDAAGSAHADITVTAAGDYRYRATAAPTKALAAVSSTPIVIRADPDPVSVSPSLNALSENAADAIESFSQDSGVLVFGDDAPSEIDQLVPGDVISIPPREDTTSGSLVKIASEIDTESSTTFNVVSADLTEVVENVPDDATEIAMVPLADPVVSDVGDGVVIETTPARGRQRSGQALNVNGRAITATIDKKFKQTSGGVEITSSLKGRISVTPTVELDIDIDWLRLQSYRLAAGLKTEESLTLKAKASTDQSWNAKLFSISMTRGGLIGVVPVWATFEGDVTAYVGVSGRIETTVEWTRSGVFAAGVQGTRSGDFIPRAYESRGTDGALLAEVKAAGHAEGRIQGTAQLSLYSLIGPYASVGYEAVGDIAASGSSGGATTLTCSLYHRPLASVGIRTSAVLKKITGRTFSPFSHDFDFAKHSVAECPAPGSQWRVIQRMPNSACGIRVDNTGWCWGDNEFGSVGNGTTTLAASPQQLPGEWTSIKLGDGGSQYVCGIRTDDTGWCWGWSAADTDGNGDRDPPALTPRQLPGRWASIHTTNRVTCGIQTDDTGWCWGRNENGGIGNGTTDDSAIPQQLPGLWRTVTPAHSHTCGLRLDGTGWCWGSNRSGDVGDGTLIDALTPHQVTGQWAALSAGSGTCGIKTDGSGWCWGYNRDGQVGNGTTDDVLVPYRLPGAWAAISMGTTICGIRTDSSGWCWGGRAWGSAGDGQSSDGPAVTPQRLPGTWASIREASGSDRVTQSISSLTNCGVQSDGTGWCWGNNVKGQVGDGTYVDALAPRQLPGTWSRIHSANEVTCGVRADNSGWCWGSNYRGSVGAGTNVATYNTPQRLPGSWAALSLDPSNGSCGIQTNGTGWCWGYNGLGAVGTGAPSDGVYSPHQLP